MQEELDLREVLRLLWKNRFLIASVVALSVVTVVAASFLTPPIYQVSGIVFLGNFNDTVYSNINSVKVLMTSDGFLSEVIEELSFEVAPNTYNSFKSGIEVDAAKDTRNLLVITCRSPNSSEGREIVQTMIRIFAGRSNTSYNAERQIALSQMSRIRTDLIDAENDINQTRKVLKELQDSQGSLQVEAELRISRTLEYLQGEEAWYSGLMDRYTSQEIKLDQLEPMRVVQEPRLPADPMQAKTALNVMMAAMFGLIIGIFAAFLREGLRELVL